MSFFLPFLISFLVYGRTLYPTVAPGDSGELITAAYTLGIPHPSGYPLYCLLGKLFSFLPVGSVAYRLNLMSAFFAALTVGTLSVTIGLFLREFEKEPSVRRMIAFGSSLVFAFSKDFWSQAVLAEVYTLHLFFVALVFWCLVRWDQSRRRGFLDTAACLLGLGLTNHHFLVFMIPVFLAWVWIEEPSLFGRTGWIARSLFLFLLPLLLYLYIPLRSAAHPPVHWNDVQGWEGLWSHVTRRNYLASWERLPQNLSLYGLRVLDLLKTLSSQLPFFFLPLFLWGLLRLFLRNSKIPFSLGILFLELLCFIAITNFRAYEPRAFNSYVVRVFYLHLPLAFSFCFAAAFHDLTKGMARFSRSSGVVLLWGTCLLPIFPLVAHYAENNKRGNALAEQYGRDLLNPLPPGQILVVGGDDANFVTLYLKVVEGIRPDLRLFSTNKGIFPTISTDEFRKVEKEIGENYPALTLYTNTPTVYAPVGWKFIQDGLLRHLVREDESYQTLRLDGVLDLNVLRPYENSNDPFDQGILLVYRLAAVRRLKDQGREEQAKSELRRASQLSADIDDIRHHLGFFCLTQGWAGEAKREFERALVLNGDHVEAKRGLGISLGLLGDYSRSAKLLKEVFEHRPRDPEVCFNLAASLGNMGYVAEALEWYRLTASLNPTYRNVQEVIKRAEESLKNPP